MPLVDGRVQRAWVAAEVVGHVRPVDDIAILTVRPEQPLVYLPGQAVPVRTGFRPGLFRWYCPANAPRVDGTIELHVRAVPGGRLSGPLVHEARRGSVLRLGTPAGTGLTLDRYSRRDLLLIAGGTGLAPLRALVEQLAAVGGDGRRVTLVVGARTIPELYDAIALDDAQRAYPWLEVVAAVSADRYALPGESGTAMEVALERGPWADRDVDVYVCGPDAMVRDAARRLVAAGMPPERLHLPDVLAASVPRRRVSAAGGAVVRTPVGRFTAGESA